MKRILIFYVHNFGWLWHNKRISLIIKELIDNFWYDVVLLNSWEKQNFLFSELRSVKIINLPEYRFDNYKVVWSYNKILNQRKIIYKKLLSLSINIESLIIEHYPFWRNFLDEEIKFLVQEYRKINNKWNVFSSIRDIVEVNSLNKENLNLFDRFLIHSDEKISNINTFFDSQVENKFIYTGYVVDRSLLDEKIKKDKYIVINLWWWQDWFDFVVYFLKKFKILNYEWKVFISLWKSFSEKNKLDLEYIYWSNLIIKGYFDDFLKLKLWADFVVSMWWYNNLVENLFYKIKTVVYPRRIDKEQTFRLDKFESISNFIKNWEHLKLDNIVYLFNLDETKIRERINFDWSYFSANFISNFRKYKYIKIRLTNFCNAKCKMCWVIKRDIQFNDINKLKQSILDFYKLWWEIVNFTWWEATIYKWFWNLLIYSKELWFITSVSTNWSTLWNQFLKNVYFNWKRLIDYVDISIDWLYKKQDVRRNYKWLFSIISKNIWILIDSWIYLHINVTIRNDNIWEMIDIFNYFKSFWIKSISFGMITSSPLNDNADLIPTKTQIEKFYKIDKPIIIRERWKILVNFSPDFDWNNLDSFYKSIKSKNSFPKKIWYKCNFINSKKEIRINENWNISPCCEIDDFEEDIWSINNYNLLDIICSKNYEDFLNKVFPNISKACLNCKIDFNYLY